VTHFSPVWLDALAAGNGRLLVPLANAERWGCFLMMALARGDFTAIQSLRRAPDVPDHTCWLAGEGWWLSTAPAGSA
jgi:alkylation response protein AidB-like acyl-CoA dehydrogenase